MKETKGDNMVYIDNRVLDSIDMKNLTELGFTLVPDKWVSLEYTEYKIYVKAA